MKYFKTIIEKKSFSFEKHFVFKTKCTKKKEYINISLNIINIYLKRRFVAITHNLAFFFVLFGLAKIQNFFICLFFVLSVISSRILLARKKEKFK